MSLAEAISTLDVVVVGDGCLDIYWTADMTLSQLSRETPHFPLPVAQERIELGAAANVTQGFASLGVARARLLTVIGDDWRGRILRELLDREGLDSCGLVAEPGRWTPAYVKPVRVGSSGVAYEDPRLDFASATTLTAETEAELLRHLETMLQDGPDAVVVADQLSAGTVTPGVRARLEDWGRQHLLVVDSRERIAEFRSGVLKPNHLELWQAAGQGPLPSPTDWPQFVEPARRLRGRAVCVTLAEAGALYVDRELVLHEAAAEVPPPVDIVGAGDAFLVGLTAGLAAGGDPATALKLGARTAAAVLPQLRTTGTIRPEQVWPA